jgi:aldose sugar dehydrogenase
MAGNKLETPFILPFMLSFLVYVFSCSQQNREQPVPGNNGANNTVCQLVEEGFGPEGTVEVGYETVVSGLEVPWGMAFLPNGDLLVTERPGRIRLVRNVSEDAQLLSEPVATVEVASSAEGGLLGLAIHPDFEQNRLFYIYLTVEQNGETSNQVERWQLSEDGSTAERERIIFEGIRASRFHNGGRIRFGPDGMLYVGTGDAGQPELSQDPQSPNGKLLRLTPEGDIPEDNPISGNPAFLTGIRNTQGWDWPGSNDATTVWLTDHGPSGELGRRGHDEINVAQAGDNLGWPDIYGCEQQEDLLRPVLSWEQAAPPGGAAIYTGNQISEWEGDLLVATLGSRHLHRAVVEDGSIAQHEVYFQDEIGRLRELMMGPDGSLYMTTSNCDGRGDCPSEGDQILRITR